MNYFELIIALLSIVVSFFSPIPAYIFSVISLIMSGRKRSCAAGLSILAFCHSGSLIFASRDVFSESSDFPLYYEVFKDICKISGTKMLNHYFNFEPGLPIFYFGASNIVPCDIRVQILIYLQSFIFSSAFLLLSHNVIYNQVEIKHRSLVLTGTCLYFPFFMTTQLGRQFGAMPFLVFAIYLAQHNASRIFTLSTAMLFHSTSIITYIFAYLIRRFGYSLIITGSVLFFLSMPSLIEFANQDNDLITSKLFFYSQSDIPEAGPASDKLTVAVSLFVYALTFFVKIKNALVIETRSLMFAVAALSALMLPFPLMSTRVFLFYVTIFGGFYIFHISASVNIKLGWVLIFLLLSARIFLFVNSGSGGEHSLWHNWPMWSVFPGYYFL